MANSTTTLTGYPQGTSPWSQHRNNCAIASWVHRMGKSRVSFRPYCFCVLIHALNSKKTNDFQSCHLNPNIWGHSPRVWLLICQVIMFKGGLPATDPTSVGLVQWTVIQMARWLCCLAICSHLDHAHYFNPVFDGLERRKNFKLVMNNSFA